MILVDTSVWADHFRSPIAEMEGLLASVMLVQHPFVTAEIALGSLSHPARTIAMLESLAQAQTASQVELMDLIRMERLGGAGIGFVDVHLLAACRLSGSALWTRDKRLRAQAQRLGLAWRPE